MEATTQPVGPIVARVNGPDVTRLVTLPADSVLHERQIFASPVLDRGPDVHP